MLTTLARRLGEKVARPIADLLWRMGLTPNAVTVLGLVLTAAVSVVLAMGRLQLAGVLLILTLGADAIDGTMARMKGVVSRFGAFLDSTLDRWAEVFLYGALVWHYLQTDQKNAVMLATAALATSLLVSYTRARAEGVGLPCKEGLLTRFERLVLLIAGLITGLTFWALAIIALLAGFTAVQRIWVTWRLDQATP